MLTSESSVLVKLFSSLFLFHRITKSFSEFHSRRPYHFLYHILFKIAYMIENEHGFSVKLSFNHTEV